MRKILILVVLLTACEQQATTKVNETTQLLSSEQQVVPQAVSIPIDRTIKRIPLGDERLIGTLAENWLSELDDDLLSELITATETIALLPLTQMEVPRLQVNHEFIPQHAVGLRSAYQEYAGENKIYTVLKTIWRTDDLHIALAGTQEIENAGAGIAQRTDLLVLKDEEIVDGITVYYSLSESAWGAYQLFYIDENKQIWLQRFVNDEEGVQTMESMSLAVLPNGKIRALTGLAVGR